EDEYTLVCSSSVTWGYIESKDGKTGTGASPSHTYTRYGTYYATLTVTDNDGLTDSDTATVTVTKYTPSNQKPKADAGSDKTAYVGETIDFSGADSYDPDGYIYSYNWAFGDDETASGMDVQHVYSEPNVYTVTLTVMDNGGKVDTDTCVVTVTEVTPEVGTLSIDTEPVKGEVFVEGESWGFAPQSQVVEVGTYTVTFGDVDGYTTPEAKVVDVEAGLTTDVMGTYVEIPPEKGTLSITTTPVDGEVFVNEESWGTSPAPREVEVGAYTVTYGEVSGYVTPDP
ncbi:unnamed protein product, partial [marine sediment metagenome]